MRMPEKIADLAKLERRLMADLAAVRVRISERAGQVDPDAEPEPEPEPEPTPEPEPAKVEPEKQSDNK